MGRKTYRYDTRGNCTEEIFCCVGGDNEGAPMKTLYKYNSTGNLIQIKQTGKNNVLFGTSRYKHDARGNPILESVYDRGGVLFIVEKSSYRFDTRGNWVEKRTKEWRRLIKEGPLTFIGVTRIKRYIQYH